MPNNTVENASASVERVAVADLLFDSENPRFAESFSGRSQEEIQRAIFGAPYFASELVDSFLENGYIQYEPLIVRPKGKKYVVVEGNRRLAAIREILQNKAKYTSPHVSELDKIPVLVFPGDLSDRMKKQIRVYLGVRHLLGIRDWPPISKAKYLEREVVGFNGLNKVMEETRLTKSQIRRFLVPYRLLVKAKADLPPEEDFWMLGEAVGRRGVQKYLQLAVDPKTLEVESFDRDSFKTLLDDIYGPKPRGGKGRDASLRIVSDTRDLSNYAKVLDSDRATKALRSGKTLSQALIFVDNRNESLKRLSALVKEMRLLVGKLTENDKSSAAGQMLQDLKALEGSVKKFEASARKLG